MSSRCPEGSAELADQNPVDIKMSRPHLGLDPAGGEMSIRRLDGFGVHGGRAGRRGRGRGGGGQGEGVEGEETPPPHVGGFSVWRIRSSRCIQMRPVGMRSSKCC